MATGYLATNNGIMQLTDLLGQIEEAGLPKPDNCLLGDYLQFLVQHQILTPESAPRVESICYESRYGGRYSAAEILGETIAQVDAALTRIKALDFLELSKLAEELTNSFAVTQASRSHDKSSSPISPHPVSQQHPLPVTDGQDATFEEPSRPFSDNRMDFRKPNLRARFWSRLLIGLLLWTTGVVVAGYFAHDQIQAAIDRFSVIPPEGELNSVDRNRMRRARRYRLNNSRAMILANNDEESRVNQLKSLAQTHLRRHEYAELFYVYERLLARKPLDPDIKNNLAWALLTSHDMWYRDPLRAQALAEEAVQANPEPAYLDTLAEAYHQNGDHQRAEELEEQAIAANPQKFQHYQKQLLKFRDALARKSMEGKQQSPPAAN